MPPELQAFLFSSVGWVRFWLLPRLMSAALIAFAAYLFIRWLDGRWQSWLRPILIGARDRSAVQTVWRQTRLLALPRTFSRIVVFLAALWLIAERFQVPNQVIAGMLLFALFVVLWAFRHLFADLSAGYVLVLEDTLSEGDWVSSSFGEGMVERIGWFAVHLRTNNGTQIVIPHRALASTALKVHRHAPQTMQQ
ncbi:MAG: hypothetical protein IMHGJWDQ_000272 [Candidatus Fervidibacter sp.]